MTRALSTMPPPSGQMIVTDWRDYQKNTLQSFFSLTLPSGLRLLGCGYHMRADGRRWVSMPAEKYTKADGEVSYKPIVEFADKAAHDRFQRAALDAIDRYLAGLAGRSAR
jgi:hypothetical protein